MNPLWQPRKNAIIDSRLYAFYETVKTHADLPDAYDYQALHQWSTECPEAFWQSVWQFFKVIGVAGERVLTQGEELLETRWFPDADLNFAENLLRGPDDHVALSSYTEDGHQRSMTYGELKREVAIVAAYLSAQGVVPGDRVAGFLPNSIHAVVAMLATSAIGGVWSSCSPDFGIAGVVDRFQQISPKVLVACTGYTYAGKRIDTRERVQQISAAINSLNALLLVPTQYPADCEPLRHSDSNHPSKTGTTASAKGITTSHWQALLEANQAPPALTFVRQNFSAPLYILYSSGTTGKPKCIVHSQGGTLLQHLKELALHTNVRPKQGLFYYTTCGWMMWNWLVSGLALGAHVVLYDGSPFHPHRNHLWDIAEREQIQHFGASAKYYAACEKYDLVPAASHRLTCLQTLMSTGSPLAHESFEYVYRAIKSDVCLASISGGTDIISCFALGNPTLPVYRGELQCAGLGMDLAFYSDTAELLEQGKGELVCRSAFPSMPTGFWGDDTGARYRAAYFSRFPGVWAHGDFGEFNTHSATDDLPPQRGVIIHGRSDAVLNPGGVRIGTAEIYRQVEHIDAVFEALAIGQQWQGDVRVVLFVVLKEGLTLDEALITTIKRQIRQNTTPRHVPAKIIQVPELPKTLSGKIVELAVRNVVHGEAVSNRSALANPEALDAFKDLPALNE